MTSTEKYDAWHAEIGTSVSAHDIWYRLVWSNMVAERDLSGKQLLEIGCGRGGFACWLGTRQPGPSKIIAADFSEVAVEKGRALAREHDIPNVFFEQQDIQNISHPASAFDTVVSCETIEHVPDPRKAVQELARVLKSSGRLFLTFPNYLSSFGLYRGFLRATGRRFTEVGQPINQFTMLPAVQSWVKAAGLEVELADARGVYAFWPGRNPWAVEALETWIPPAFKMHSVVVARKP